MITIPILSLFVYCPFLKMVHPSLNVKNLSITDITNEDHQVYLIYDQTHKIVNPESFLFYNRPVRFLGIKNDSIGNILSALIYVHKDAHLIDEIITEFGAPTSSSKFSGEIYGRINSEINYESLAWKKENQIMLVAEYPLKKKFKDKRQTLLRIYIKTISI